MQTSHMWNVSVAIVGIIAVAAIVIAGMRAGIDGVLAMTGLSVIGGAIGYAIKNRPTISRKERTGP